MSEKKKKKENQKRRYFSDYLYHYLKMPMKFYDRIKKKK